MERQFEVREDKGGGAGGGSNNLRWRGMEGVGVKSEMGWGGGVCGI